MTHRGSIVLLMAACVVACALIAPAGPVAAWADTAGTSANDEEAAPKITTIKKTLRVYQQIVIVGAEASGTIKWKSSNKKVAKVTKTGIITAKRKGKATIFASFDDGRLVCKLTVKKSKFKPVKLTKLANYSNFRQRASYAQLKKAYKKALKIVRPFGDLGKKKRLMGVANALRALYDEGKVTYSTTAAHYNDPYGYLVKGKASCAGCTRATGMCLNILGIKYEHVNENKWTHQWCRVKVGKAYWICDAYGLYCGKEPGKRKHPFL